MLEHAWTRDVAVLRDVTDEHGGDAALLRHRDERGRHGADLRDAARDAFRAGCRDGLYGVDDEQPRLHRVEMAEHRLEVGLGREEEAIMQGADALRTQAHLACRLLAGDDEARGLSGGRP